MKFYNVFSLLSFSITLFSQNPSIYADEINADDLKEKLYTYASDEFQGRETGTEGQKIAIEYLRQQYQALGVGAAKSNGDYFQNVPLKVIKTPKVSIAVGENTYRNFSQYKIFKIRFLMQ